MTYAFPLPKCSTHTYKWEDGEHDNCYRCGADRPETQEDRGTLAKESTAALNTEPLEEGTIMEQSTKTEATPGFRVEHKYTGEQGTVTATGTDTLGQHVTVKWDNDEAVELPAVLHTKHIEVVPERETGRLSSEFQAELIRRGFVENISEGDFIEFVGPVVDRNTYQIKPVFNTVSGFEFFLDHGNDSSDAFTVKELCDLHKHISLLLKDLGFDVTDWAANFGRLPLGAR